MFYFFELQILKIIIITNFIFSVSKFYDSYAFSFKNKDFESMYDYYNEKDEKKKTLKNGRLFFLKCVNDILIKQNFSKINNEKPLVSVVIPVFDAEFKIKKAIRSIQNQNISNLEIILVNDFSKDKTINVIKDLQKEDDRILLLENNENKGIFYSRCIGTLIASGKYIFPLDNDDLFFDEGVISTIVNKSIIGNYEIVEFNYAEFYNSRIPPNKLITTEFGNHSDNLILYQPELSQFPRNKNNRYGVYDCYLWAKCIKADLYKTSINKIGIKTYSKYILRGEDFIMTFVLFRFAKSFNFFAKYGIFRYKNFKTAQYQSSRELFLLSRIIYIDIIRRFTAKNYNDKLYVSYFCDTIFYTIRREFCILNDENKIYFKKVFNKLLINKYITDEYKEKYNLLFENITCLNN